MERTLSLLFLCFMVDMSALVRANQPPAELVAYEQRLMQAMTNNEQAELAALVKGHVSQDALDDALRHAVANNLTWAVGPLLDTGRVSKNTRSKRIGGQSESLIQVAQANNNQTIVNLLTKAGFTI